MVDFSKLLAERLTDHDIAITPAPAGFPHRIMVPIDLGDGSGPVEYLFFMDDNAAVLERAEIADGRRFLVAPRGGADAPFKFLGFSPDGDTEDAGLAVSPELQDDAPADAPRQTEAMGLSDESIMAAFGADTLNVPRVDETNTVPIVGSEITDLGFPSITDGWSVTGVVIGETKVEGSFGDEEEVLDPSGKPVRDHKGEKVTQTMQDVYIIQGTCAIDVVGKFGRPRRVLTYGRMMVRKYSRLVQPIGEILKRQDAATLLARSYPGKEQAPRVWIPIRLTFIGRGPNKEVGPDGKKGRDGSAYFEVVVVKNAPRK